MKIIRAEHLGMCFGVRDAIKLALTHREREPLTVLGELVHNEKVLSILRDKGIQIESDVARVRTPAAMITAHGASQAAMERVRERGLKVLEATCPLVHFAHRAVARLVADGFHPVIIGKRDHVEVRGIIEDLAEYDVILSDEEVERLQPRAKFGIASQTTQPIDRVRYLVESIRQRFPESEVRFADTVCQPTKQRQSAAELLAAQVDVVVVIGGANSNNTRELVSTCSRYCDRVFHVQDAAALRSEWFAEAASVGITAGTSTPDSTIASVEKALRQLNRECPTDEPAATVAYG